MILLDDDQTESDRGEGTNSLGQGFHISLYRVLTDQRSRLLETTKFFDYESPLTKCKAHATQKPPENVGLVCCLSLAGEK
jgi:hypothetical protein